jgi:hypothetical protein
VAEATSFHSSFAFWRTLMDQFGTFLAVVTFLAAACLLIGANLTLLALIRFLNAKTAESEKGLELLKVQLVPYREP